MGATLLVILMACRSFPRVDMTNDDLGPSLKRVRDSLPEDQRTEFELALAALISEELGRQAPPDIEAAVARLKDRISGKTGAEIIAEGRKARQERERREREESGHDQGG